MVNSYLGFPGSNELFSKTGSVGLFSKLANLPTCGDGGGGQAGLSTASCSTAQCEGQCLFLMPMPGFVLVTFVFAFLAGHLHDQVTNQTAKRTPVERNFNVEGVLQTL